MMMGSVQSLILFYLFKSGMYIFYWFAMVLPIIILSYSWIVSGSEKPQWMCSFHRQRTFCSTFPPSKSSKKWSFVEGIKKNAKITINFCLAYTLNGSSRSKTFHSICTPHTCGDGSFYNLKKRVYIDNHHVEMWLCNQISVCCCKF